MILLRPFRLWYLNVSKVEHNMFLEVLITNHLSGHYTNYLLLLDEM